MTGANPDDQETVEVEVVVRRGGRVVRRHRYPPSVWQDEGGGSGAPAWLPSGAVAYIAQGDGHFYAGGAEVAEGDVIEPASALDWGAGASKLLGAAKAAVLAGATVVFRYTVTGGVQSLFLDLADSPDYNAWLEAKTDATSRHLIDGGDLALTETDDTNTIGAHVFGVTLTETHSAMCFDGGPVASQDLAIDFSAFAEVVPIAEGVTIDSITIYAPKTDAGLQAVAS